MCYAIPKLDEVVSTIGGRNENETIHQYLYDNNIQEISSKKLTPMLRANYTAMLLVCDPDAGTPQEFYSIKGSMGSKLSLREDGMLLWDVASITSSEYIPAVNFTLRGKSRVFRYTFDSAGMLVNQEDTGEIVNFSKP